MGVYLSLKIDLPTGATIVCTFGLVLILMALARGFIKRLVEGRAPESTAVPTGSNA